MTDEHVTPRSDDVPWTADTTKWYEQHGVRQAIVEQHVTLRLSNSQAAMFATASRLDAMAHPVTVRAVADSWLEWLEAKQREPDSTTG